MPWRRNYLSLTGELGTTESLLAHDAALDQLFGLFCEEYLKSYDPNTPTSASSLTSPPHSTSDPLDFNFVSDESTAASSLSMSSFSSSEALGFDFAPPDRSSLDAVVAIPASESPDNCTRWTNSMAQTAFGSVGDDSSDTSSSGITSVPLRRGKRRNDRRRVQSASRMKKAHKEAEKQYRMRLSMNLASLYDLLPREDDDADCRSARPGKATILKDAKAYILALRERVGILERENKYLESSLPATSRRT